MPFPADPAYALGHAHACLAKAAGDAVKTDALSGRLYFSRSGWLLLSVPNALGRGAFDALDEAGVELPLNSTGQYNAHVSVMTPAEVAQCGGPEKITERGHSYRYSLGAVKEVVPAGQGDLSKVWYIEVTSPDLRELRKSYGLTPQPHGDWDFHCTFAVRKKNVLRANAVSKAAGYGAGDPRFGCECPMCGGTKTSGARAHQTFPDGTWDFANAVCADCENGFSFDYDTMKPKKRTTGSRGQKAAKADRPTPADWNAPADREDCPLCGAMHERGDGYCNRCGGRWPAVTKAAAERLLGLLAKEAAPHPALAVLLEAKAESDRRNYARKHALMRALMAAGPADFAVDSGAGTGVLGLTHTPTDFRMHLPAGVVPPAVRTVKAAEALLEKLAELPAMPPPAPLTPRAPPTPRAFGGALARSAGTVLNPVGRLAGAATRAVGSGARTVAQATAGAAGQAARAAGAAARTTADAGLRAGKWYGKGVAGYGEGGALQGQKLLDSTTVKPRLYRPELKARLAAGATPEELAKTHQLPGLLDRLPGGEALARAGHALNTNRVTHPVVQTLATAKNLVTTPPLRPFTDPARAYLGRAAAANLQGGAVRRALGRAQQAGSGALWAVDRGTGIAAQGAAAAAAGLGAVYGGRRLWNGLNDRRGVDALDPVTVIPRPTGRAAPAVTADPAAAAAAHQQAAKDNWRANPVGRAVAPILQPTVANQFVWPWLGPELAGMVTPGS